MRLRWANPKRKGVSLVETALVITAFLVLTLGAVDLGVLVLRQHILSEAARQGVRQAIVHGEGAPAGWKGGPWGPASYGPVPATDSDAKAQALAPYLGGMDPAAVQVTITWPDGSNAVGKRVQVTLATTWTPLVGFLFGNSSVTLTGSSQMRIAH
jgi:hypothetical protein